MKEIITIQVGSYANFVGSHFWNLQDELMGLQNDPDAGPCLENAGVNFDVLYRVGETTQGVSTYTPRLLAIDARGSLGAVNSRGSLYEQTPSLDITSVTSWRGHVSKHVTEPHVKNEFLKSLEQEQLEWDLQQKGRGKAGSLDANERSGSPCNTECDIQTNLEESVQFWTDYAKVYFHPLSLYELEGVWHETTPFDDYGSGKGLLNGCIKDDVLDRLRFFVEEADHMQGLKVIVDDSNGFAAVATDFLEAVVDDYDKSPILLFTTRPPSSVKGPKALHASVVGDLHNAISFSELNRFSSCTIPLGLSSFAGMSKYLKVDDWKNFHTSAVYAAAVSCITLPLRMELSGYPSSGLESVCTGSMDMANLAHFLAGRTGRQVPIMHLAMPAPPLPGSDKLEGVDFSRFHPLLSGVIETDDQLASEVVVVQGSSAQDSAIPASLQDIINCYSRKGTPFYHLAASVCPLALPLPFPDLFAPLTGSKLISTTPSLDMTSIPIATKLCPSVGILPYLEKRLHSLQHPGGRSLGWQILEGWNMQKEDVRELYELTANVVAAYKSGESAYGSSLGDSASDSE